MPSWAIRTDRRDGDRDGILQELEALASSIDGLHLDVHPEDAFFDGPDGGGFRDFAPIATLSHPDLRALELVAEELVLQFGWRIDFSKS